MTKIVLGKDDGIASLDGCDFEWLPTSDLVTLEEDTYDHQNTLVR